MIENKSNLINCKNCSHNYDGNYCPNCGQKYINKRFTLKDSIQSVLAVVFNTDHGFLFTSKAVLLNPGMVINDFINGVTVKYIHPFRFLLLWATISALLVISLGVYDEQTQLVGESFDYDQKQQAINQNMQETIKKYLSFLTLLLVPFLSIFSKMLYKKKKLYYAEHLVLNAYGFGLVSMIGIVITLIMQVVHNPQLSMILGMFSMLLLMGYVYKSTLGGNYIASIFKFFIAIILGYIVPLLIFSILLIVYMLIAKFTGWMEIPFKPT